MFVGKHLKKYPLRLSFLINSFITVIHSKIKDYRNYKIIKYSNLKINHIFPIIGFIKIYKRSRLL